MDTLTFTLDKPIMSCPKFVVHAPTHFKSGNGVKVAWEAPIVVPKMVFHTQSRYARAIPTWELQAPENGFNLASLLQVLDEVDEACVLTVRKIHKLGLNSAQILREHFSQYGEIDRVMLLPSRPKSSPNAQCTMQATLSLHGKVRPASMAFVVMRSRQPAIVARLNEIHIIEGHPIQVQKFKRDPEEDTPEVTANVQGANFVRLLSTATTASPPSPNQGRDYIAGPNGDMYAWIEEDDVASTAPSRVQRLQAKFIN